MFSVEVVAVSLYEAAALGLNAFRLSEFADDVGPGKADRLTVTVKAEFERHEVKVSDLEEWLACAGESPCEQALKVRLRQGLEGVLRPDPWNH